MRQQARVCLLCTSKLNNHGSSFTQLRAVRIKSLPSCVVCVKQFSVISHFTAIMTMTSCWRQALLFGRRHYSRANDSPLLFCLFPWIHLITAVGSLEQYCSGIWVRFPSHRRFSVQVKTAICTTSLGTAGCLLWGVRRLEHKAHQSLSRHCFECVEFNSTFRICLRYFWSCIKQNPLMHGRELNSFWLHWQVMDAAGAPNWHMWKPWWVERLNITAFYFSFIRLKWNNKS
jgi:hypothetical protein